MAKHPSEQQYNSAVDLARRDLGTGVAALAELAGRYPADSRVLHAYGTALHRAGQSYRALGILEAAARREQVYRSEVQDALAQVYDTLGMTRHSLRAQRQAGRDVSEELHGDLPAGAKTADFLEFEQARLQIMYNDTRLGVRGMEKLLGRFPGYLPAQNVLASGLYQLAEFGRSRVATQAVLAQQPRNIHALLNLARLELLEHGPDAVRALTVQVEAAAVSQAEQVVDGELARATIYAFTDDDAGVERSLNAWNPDAAQRAANPQATLLEAALRQRQHPAAAAPAQPAVLGQPPYFKLEDLLPSSMISDWKKRGKTSSKPVYVSLQTMPGLLSLLPQRLGFSGGIFARLLALVLLEHAQADWLEPLRRVVQHGPGSLEIRLALGALLQERGLIPDEVLADLGDQPGGGMLLQLEIHGDVEPVPLSRAEMKAFERALNEMQMGQMAQATELIEPLVQKYPEFRSAAFNLAVAEKHSGDPALEERSRQRLETLLERFPQYLFPRAELASEALDRGEVEQARQYLAFPKGLRRIHQQEYGTFLSVQGRLALVEGKPQEAGKLLELVGQISGEESAAYQLLERAVVGSADLPGVAAALYRRPLLKRPR